MHLRLRMNTILFSAIMKPGTTLRTLLTEQYSPLFFWSFWYSFFCPTAQQLMYFIQCLLHDLLILDLQVVIDIFGTLVGSVFLVTVGFVTSHNRSVNDKWNPQKPLVQVNHQSFVEKESLNLENELSFEQPHDEGHFSKVYVEDVEFPKYLLVMLAGLHSVCQGVGNMESEEAVKSVLPVRRGGM